jgi:hypothetical protein
MANILQAVQTYQKSSLGLLQNELVLVSKANTKFKEFNKTFAPNNLGNTVTFDKPPRFFSNDTLVVDSFDGIEQRVENLTVNLQGNVNYVIDNEEYIFNLQPNDYMDEFGRGAMAELGSKIETQVSQALIDSPYRFYGDGITPINSFGQLAQANAFFRNYGAVQGDLEVVLPDLAVPNIVNTGLNQFATNRNDDLANSWELGSYNRANYSISNLLPIHDAGTLGDAGSTLTVVSTNDPTGANITQITFSGAGTDADAVKENDLMYFLDGVSGQPNLRYRTFIGHTVSGNPVQVRLTADAASSAGNVTVTVSPALSVTPGRNQNLNTNIVAGMQAKILPTHRRGIIMGGNPLFVALPTLPMQTPFPTANKIDETSHIGLRMTYGTIFGKAQQGIIYDYILGFKLVPEYSMALVFPI